MYFLSSKNTVAAPIPSAVYVTDIPTDWTNLTIFAVLHCLERY